MLFRSSFLQGFKALEETNFDFSRDMFFKSLLVAFVVKYGELFFDAPFNPKAEDALALIIIPTLFNIGKWTARSNEPMKDSGSLNEPSRN